ILDRVEQRTGQTLPSGTLSAMIQAIDRALDEDLQPIPGALAALARIPALKAGVAVVIDRMADLPARVNGGLAGG
ncbi:MAG: hypothetical protein WBQ37_14895, partial [Candidatus Competibacter sp.]